jgi:hypothetical protein
MIVLMGEEACFKLLLAVCTHPTKKGCWLVCWFGLICFDKYF